MVGSNNLEEHIIDVEELVRSLTTGTSPLPDDATKNSIRLSVIQKVKQELRDNDTEIYEPKLVSIGPYHEGSSAVQEMQKIKYAYLDYILKLNPNKKLADYLTAIKELEMQARRDYGNEIEMDRASFVRTLLLDGCFILVALNGTEGIIPPITSYCNVLDTDTDTRDEVRADTENLNHEFLFDKTVSRDLLLLENQIPFSVVQKIHEVLAGMTGASSLLTRNIAKPIASMISCRSKKIEHDRSLEIYHLLHLCHMLLKPSYRRKEHSNPNDCSNPQFLHQSLQIENNFRSGKERVIFPTNEPGSSTICIQVYSWRQATIYHAASIEFKKKDICGGSPPYTLLDIGFCNGTIEIPSLTIDRRTYCLLRNLVAFEQACPQFGNHVSAYVVFWSQLVSTPDDVALLTDKGVIINQLQSDIEVAKLFSSLSEDVVLDPKCEYYLNPVCDVVEAHYQHRRPRWRDILGTASSMISPWFWQNS